MYKIFESSATAGRSKKDSAPIRKRVYEDLRTAILLGRLNPAERLTEEHLAQQLGVSRTPVREALYKLESEGLIKALETRGFIVSSDSWEEVEELFEIRAILEGYTLRLISKSIDKGKLARLGGMIEKAERALETRQMNGLSPRIRVCCIVVLAVMLALPLSGLARP